MNKRRRRDFLYITFWLHSNVRGKLSDISRINEKNQESEETRRRNDPWCFLSRRQIIKSRLCLSRNDRDHELSQSTSSNLGGWRDKHFWWYKSNTSLYGFINLTVVHSWSRTRYTKDHSNIEHITNEKHGHCIRMVTLHITCINYLRNLHIVKGKLRIARIAQCFKRKLLHHRSTITLTNFILCRF